MIDKKLEELELKQRLQDLMEKVDYEGGWGEYAVYCGGEADTGDKELDEAILELYTANERVHYLSNRLCIRYNLEF